MRFKNRKEAGEKLAGQLKDKVDKNTVVLAIPRGGVVVGFEVAQKYNLPLDVIIPRKLGAPHNPELAVGAVTGRGEVYLDESTAKMVGVDREYLEKEVKKKICEIEMRKKLYREGKKPVDVEGKKVILVDDGVATGSTMIAAIKALESRNPEKIIAAVPVSPIDTYHQLQKTTDEVVCLHATNYFFAVGQFYTDFTQTTHDEVKELLRKSERFRTN